MSTPPNEPADDPVARNRAVHPRRTPGRPGLGDNVTRSLVWITLALMVAATVVLVAVLLSG